MDYTKTTDELLNDLFKATLERYSPLGKYSKATFDLGRGLREAAKALKPDKYKADKRDKMRDALYEEILQDHGAEVAGALRIQALISTQVEKTIEIMDIAQEVIDEAQGNE